MVTFPGINPLLNSALQAEDDDWESFHSSQIIHLHYTPEDQARIRQRLTIP